MGYEFTLQKFVDLYHPFQIVNHISKDYSHKKDGIS